MAVDLYIGSVNTVIETASGGGADRERLIAEIMLRLRADLARAGADDQARARDAAPQTRPFGQRV